MNQPSPPSSAANLIDLVASQVLTLRGQRVLLSQQLAVLYGVETKVLNQAVRRNSGRFPMDFMFQLSREELDWVQAQVALPSVEGSSASRSQSVTLKRGQNIKYAPKEGSLYEQTRIGFTAKTHATIKKVSKNKKGVA